MTITARLTSIVIFIFMTTILGTTIVLTKVVLPGFEEIEMREARAAVSRINNAIQGQLEELERLALDWSYWDDTWEFAQDRNQEYVTSNLVIETFVDIDISVIWFVDRQGQTIWTRMLADTKDRLFDPDDVPSTIAEGHVFHAMLDTETTTRGFLEFGGKLHLVVASPILKSDSSGGIQGFLMFGRLFDDAHIELIAERLHQNVNGSTGIETVLADMPEAVRSEILSEPARTPILDFSGSEAISGYLRIDTLEGRPATMITTVVPRDIRRVGADTVVLSAMLLLISVGSALAIGFALARKTIASPVQSLVDHIDYIGRTGDLDREVDLSGKAEFSRIAGAFNKMQQDLQKLTHFDPVTGLPNRILFRDRASQAMIRSQREGRKTAIMFIDLDRFKYVNDTFGHDFGDNVLRAVGERLSKNIRTSDTVARLGGDEFAIVAGNLDGPRDAEALAKTLIKTFEEPVSAADRDSFVGASMGITLFPEDGSSIEDLLKNADIAMFRAKAAGGGFQFFGAETSKAVKARLKLENELRLAMNREAFEIFYQPQVYLQNRRICGAEALIRWNHPEDGWRTASRFMPFIEEIGMFRRVDEWVFRRIGEHGGTMEFPDKDFTLAVNLSSREFQTPDIRDMLAAGLQQLSGLKVKLELEITENALVKRSTASEQAFELLAEHGVTLALDDFGTGYSSLAYLKQMPVGTLKIDNSFVQDIADNPVSQSIVLAIVSLGQSLSLRVIAEGVENERQEKALIRFGCLIGQGNFYGPPEPPGIFSRRIS
ncbi:MAG: EAL domain-containing protein [Rhodospirillales bacterium]